MEPASEGLIRSSNFASKCGRCIDRLMLPVLMVTTAIAVRYAFADFHFGGRTPDPPVVISATTDAVIGNHPSYLSDPHAKYTLVEFMDYQCPPCRSLYSALPSVLAKYKGKVRLTVRQYPLDMHENARIAALASEAARRQGNFWRLHNAMFTAGDLDPNRINSIARANGYDMTKFAHDIKAVAPQIVKRDQFDANKFGLTGTPTVFLCCEDGKVLRLDSVDQIGEFVK